MTTKQLVNVREIAQMLGVTESAIRNRLSSRADSIPPPFKFGGQWRWRIKDVETWLEEQATGKKAPVAKRKRGRPRISEQGQGGKSV